MGSVDLTKNTPFEVSFLSHILMDHKLWYGTSHLMEKKLLHVMFDKCKWEIYVTLFNLLQYEPLFLLQLSEG